MVVGFVGLGNMGAPMAAHLIEGGFTVLVNDVDAAAMERFHAAHGGRVATRAEIGGLCDVLILMLPDGKIVRDFLLAEGAGPTPADALKPGSIVIDMSSSAPLGTRDVGAVLAERHVALVDAPVSGGVARARTGTLAVMAGGEAATIERLQPIFARLAKTVTHVGPLGSGHAMKALNNYVSAAGLLAACEALRVAETFGIEGERVIEVLNASTGRNNSTEHKIGQFVLSGTYASGFTLGLMRKDLATALDLAHQMKVDLPLAEHFVGIWADAERKLGRAADHTEIDRMVSAPPRPA
jgi:3-hydroxyisobutyrate dehydrogenase